MNTAQLIQAGRLADARAALTDEVKASPNNLAARHLLFQVLAFHGEWDKAERHLDIMYMQAPERQGRLQHYRNQLAAEKVRSEVEAGKQMPDFMTDAPSYFGDFMAARKKLASGNGDDFVGLLLKLADELPPLRGAADGIPFEGFLNCDATLSWFLEAFIHDRYIWFPMVSIRELCIQQPSSLMDLLWCPAKIMTWDGLATDCYLPVLYPGTAGNNNEQIRLGRMTDWKELPGGYVSGVGQHVFQVGDEEKGILELREVTFSAGTILQPSVGLNNEI